MNKLTYFPDSQKRSVCWIFLNDHMQCQPRVSDGQRDIESSWSYFVNDLKKVGGFGIFKTPNKYLVVVHASKHEDEAVIIATFYEFLRRAQPRFSYMTMVTVEDDELLVDKLGQPLHGDTLAELLN